MGTNWFLTETASVTIVGTTVTTLSTLVPNLSTVTAVNEVTDPIAEALFGRTRRRLLGLLYGRSGESFHLREIAREIGTGLGAVQRELNRLWRAGLVTREPQGPQVHFAASRESPVFRELQSLFAKTGGVQATIRAELQKLRRARLVDFGFIYGSVAVGKQKPESDIDLMVIGGVPLARLLPALRRLQVDLGREINPTVFRRDEFIKKYSTRDHFIRRVMDNRKLMLVGTEDELKDLVREPLDRRT